MVLMVNFMCLFAAAMVPRYMAKYYSGDFNEEIF